MHPRFRRRHVRHLLPAEGARAEARRRGEAALVPHRRRPHRSTGRPGPGCPAPVGRRGDRRQGDAHLPRHAPRQPRAHPGVGRAARRRRRARRAARGRHRRPRRARVPARRPSSSGTDPVVADYVPFLLTTDAHVWDAVRTATPDPRLDPAAVERPAADYVIFVSSVGIALGARTDVRRRGRAQRRRRRRHRCSHRRPNGPRSSGCCVARTATTTRPRSPRPSSSCARRCRSNGSLIAVVERAGARPGARGAQGCRSAYPGRGVSAVVPPAANSGARRRRVAGLLEQRALRLLDAREVREPVGAVVPEHPVAVEHEAERRAEREAHDVRRDVVGDEARVAEQVVADPEAAERDGHAAERDDHVLGELAHVVAPTVPAEGPVAVAEPVEDDRDARRDGLRADGRLRPVCRRRRRRAAAG